MSEADGLRGKATQLDADAAELIEQAKAMRVEAARLRARADRLDEPERGIRVRRTALARARDDGMLAAAGVACEELAAPFTVADLAAALEIRDEARAMRLMLALSEIGHVERLSGGGGWMIHDPVMRDVRDYVTGAGGAFTFGDVMAAMGGTHPELDVSDALAELVDRGIIEGEGGSYAYVQTPPHSAPREDRRPPELEPPAGTERRARGEAVRVVNHGKRGQQMQGGNRRHVIRKDQNRERAEQQRLAKEAARQAARADSARETKVRRK